MNILDKRPLGLILCVILGGFSVFVFLSPLIRSLLVAFAISFSILAFSLFKRNTLLKIASLALLFSIFASFLYFDVSFYPNKLYGKDSEIVARVLDVNSSSEGYQSLTVRVKTVDSNKKRIKLNVNVYGMYDEIKPGSIVKFKTEIEELKSDESFNFKQYYTSRGISASADITHYSVEGFEKEPLSYKCKLMRENIAKRAESLSNLHAGSMLSALLLGERDRLTGQLNLDFLRTGITHILALSGTHVVLLAAAVNKILSLFHINKKYRLVIGCVFVAMFMALTGFPLSVCRAGVMLILSTLLFLLTGCKDGITSLLMASVLIIAVTPYASQDVGLWLSILATAGILVAGEMLNENYSYETGLKRTVRYVFLSFAFSLFAISATVILSMLCFTGMSVMGAFATFVFSILTEIYVYVGIAMLIFGNIIPIGKILILCEEIIANSVGFLSDLPFSYSSSEFAVVKIMFLTLGISFAVFAFAKIKHKRVYLTCLCILFVFANIIPIGMTEQVKQRDTMLFASDSYDRIFIRTDEETLLFDVSNSSKSSAYINNSLLIEEKVVELDYYIVANYGERLTEGINKVLSSNLVKEVKLPKPKNDAEHNIALDVFRLMEDYRTNLSFYDDTEGFTAAGFEILIPHRADNLVSILFRRNDEIYTYISEGLLEDSPSAEDLLYVSNYIVFGGYGRECTKMKYIDDFDKRLKVIASYDKHIDFDLSYTPWEPPKLYLPKSKFYFYK